jgi:hypothetical protein
MRGTTDENEKPIEERLPSGETRKELGGKTARPPELNGQRSALEIQRSHLALVPLPIPLSGTGYADQGLTLLALPGSSKNSTRVALTGIPTTTRNCVSTGKSSVTFTRMRAPYVNPDGFIFAIYRKGVFSTIGKWLGMQDVCVGYPEFDEAFIIKGNDEWKLRRFFSNQKIRQLISAQPDIRFFVDNRHGRFWSKSLPKGVDELYFEVVGVIKDVDRLKLLYELFSETLDELCRMGSAYEDDPQVAKRTN